MGQLGDGGKALHVHAAGFDRARHRRADRALLLFELRGERARHRSRRQLSGVNRQVQIVGIARPGQLGTHVFQNLGSHQLAHRELALPEVLLQHVVAVLQRLAALQNPEVVADLASGAAGGGKIQPVAAGRAALVGDDLDHVAVLEFVAQRDDRAVDPRPDGGVADAAVDVVGEIHRGRALRQTDGVAPGREHEHPPAQDVVFHRVHEVRGVGEILLKLAHLREPVLALLLGQRAALLVHPVGRHPELGHHMHPPRADLHLDRLPALADDGGVQALVTVGLGHRDVVLEAPRNRRPHAVDDAQRVVADPLLAGFLGALLLAALGSVDRLGRQDQANGQQIENLLQRLAFLLHLVVNAPEVLAAPGDVLFLDPFRQLDVVGQLGAQLLDGLQDVGFPLFLAGAQAALQVAVGVGVEVLEAEVFEFPFDLPDAEPVGQRREDLQRLAGDALLLFRLHRGQGAHVVQSVGQLDDDDADIAGHGDQHLAQVLGLLVLQVGAQLGQFADLGLALHDPPHVRAELRLDHGEGHAFHVFYRVVEKARRDGVGVQAQLRQDVRHRHRMGDVRLAALAVDPLVGVAGKGVSGFEFVPFFWRALRDQRAEEFHAVHAPQHSESLERRLSPVALPPAAAKTGYFTKNAPHRVSGGERDMKRMEVRKWSGSAPDAHGHGNRLRLPAGVPERFAQPLDEFLEAHTRSLNFAR